MANALGYMYKHQISRACVVLLARRGKVTKVNVGRSTGDITLDRKFADGLVRDVDVWKRVELKTLPQDEKGRRIVKYDVALAKDFRGRVLGCDVK